MWNERYAAAEFAYGKEPNDFLAGLDLGQGGGKEVMCLAEGQGRNAVYLAGLGFAVTAVDLSETGLARTQELAAERGVQVRTLQADLGLLELEEASLDGIVMIFGHTPPAVRQHVHRQILRGLRPGGSFVLEGYRKEQLQYRTGGPHDESLLYSLEELIQDFGVGMEWEVAHAIEREIQEGAFHNGLSAVVQVYGRRTGTRR